MPSREGKLTCMLKTGHCVFLILHEIISFTFSWSNIRSYHVLSYAIWTAEFTVKDAMVTLFWLFSFGFNRGNWPIYLIWDIMTFKFELGNRHQKRASFQIAGSQTSRTLLNSHPYTEPERKGCDILSFENNPLPGPADLENTCLPDLPIVLLWLITLWQQDRLHDFVLPISNF